MGLHRVSERVRFVGSYPRADGGRTITGSGPSESEFEEARSWLDRLRAGAAS